MQHLFKTWGSIFPKETLQKIESTLKIVSLISYFFHFFISLNKKQSSLFNQRECIADFAIQGSSIIVNPKFVQPEESTHKVEEHILQPPVSILTTPTAVMKVNNVITFLHFSVRNQK
jgi:hypothetical protein